MNAWTQFRARWRLQLPDWLTAPAPDSDLQEYRIRFMERNVGLPVRVLVILLLAYYLFFTNWVGAVTYEREKALEMVQRAFLIYTVLNIALGALLLGMAQVPLRLIQWLVIVMGVVDALFVSGLTLVTGGFDSVLYWVYLALIVRNAFSIPLAAPQITLNLLVSLCYLLAGRLDAAVVRIEVAKHLVAEAPADVTEPFILRVVLLLLMTACCYGVQVLFDKQRRADAETREFIVRQEQLRSAGRLAAEIAHQIKNPLGIINNAAFTLQRTVKEGKGTITQQIQIIREEVERSDRIITELMGYAQLTEGKVEKLIVTEELDRAIDRVLPVAAKFDIQIRRTYAPSLPPLLIQRSNLAEIFANLLQNAREALNGHGQIEVTARLGEGHTVVVTIADNGPGIPADVRERVFEPYFTTKEKGTGLGLAIVKHNVEMYGGTVHIESELGKGTCFILELPARTVMRLRK